MTPLSRRLQSICRGPPVRIHGSLHLLERRHRRWAAARTRRRRKRAQQLRRSRRTGRHMQRQQHHDEPVAHRDAHSCSSIGPNSQSRGELSCCGASGSATNTKSQAPCIAASSWAAMSAACVAARRAGAAEVHLHAAGIASFSRGRLVKHTRLRVALCLSFVSIRVGRRVPWYAAGAVSPVFALDLGKQ